ncbi:MAG: putative lipid II flippase FtsW [Deltaproteobacteria bacterium]|nr:putative lipid II flippase FtsW [Deltaproteobacteria bacterium]
MIRLRDYDRLLIIATLMLLVMGLLMVYSTSSVVALKRFGNQYFFVKKQLTYVLAGVICFVGATRVPYGFYRRMAYPILILSALALICIYIPGLGFTAGGARRWVRLGPIAFQPSEPAKLAVIFFLAYSLAAKQEKIKEFSIGFLPNILIPGVIILLIMLEPDLGTSIALASIVLLLNFIAGVRIRYLLYLVLAAAPFIYVVIHKFSYMMTRIMIFLDPWKDPEGKGFQMVQSFLAFGAGGVRGVGLGEGKQKLFYLPEAHTDFILSVIGEELGFIGVAAVTALYALFLYCGIKIAMKARDRHGMYLALGLTFMVVLQAAFNSAVVMGLLPPKGLPLPFISYGGTSLLVNMIAVGVLLNIYIHGNEA